MKRSGSKLLLLLAAVLLLYAACRKTDNGFTASAEPNEKNFFNEHLPDEPNTKAAKDYMLRVNSRQQVVSRIISKIGYPWWDKALIIDKAPPASRGSVTGDSAIFVYVPFVRENDDAVNGSLVVRMTETDTAWRVLSDRDYQAFGFDTTNTSQWNARDLFSILTNLDHKVFGRTSYKILDGRILGGSQAQQYTVHINYNSKTAGRSSSWSGYFICGTVYICPVPENTGGRSHTQFGNCPPRQLCVLYYVYVDDDIPGDGGWNTGGLNPAGNTGGCTGCPPGTGGGSGGSGGSGPGGGPIIGNCTGNHCLPGWENLPLPDPDPSQSLSPDSLLKLYSQKIKDTAINIYDNLSKPPNVEYAFTGIWQNNEVEVFERTTNNDSLIVMPKTMIGNKILLFTWHSHVSSHPDPANRGCFSSDDIEMLRNPRCMKLNFISFADTRTKRYALVITDLNKARNFMAQNKREQILDNYFTTGGGNMQEVQERCVINVIDRNSINGIALYVSTDAPGFQNWTLLNP